MAKCILFLPFMSGYVCGQTQFMWPFFHITTFFEKALTRIGIRKSSVNNNTSNALSIPHPLASHLPRMLPPLLKAADAVLVPGAFGNRKGKIIGAKYVCENNIPYLRICIGMQIVVIEYAPSIPSLENANITEFDSHTKHPGVIFMPEENGTSARRSWVQFLEKTRVPDECRLLNSVSPIPSEIQIPTRKTVNTFPRMDTRMHCRKNVLVQRRTGTLAKGCGDYHHIIGM